MDEALCKIEEVTVEYVKKGFKVCYVMMKGYSYRAPAIEIVWIIQMHNKGTKTSLE